jgi:DNA-binding GntR family transcriptional regulator
MVEYKFMKPVAHARAVPSGLLKQNIAERLRQEILSASIPPGGKVVEGKWARELGVAQVSVREALNILAEQGLVTKGHGRSARVLNLEDTDIIDIFRVRGVLEGLAARIIVERRLPLDDLQAALSEIEKSVDSEHLSDVIERVRHFHLLLLEKAANPVLKLHGERLIFPLFAFTQMRAAAKKLAGSFWRKEIPLHRLIVDVLRLGNPHVAEQTLIDVTNCCLESARSVWAP